MTLDKIFFARHREQDPMEFLEIEEKRQLRREEAAAFLVQLADSLARHNSLEFSRDGMRYTVKVPDSLELEVEFEVGDKGGSLEIELNW